MLTKPELQFRVVSAVTQQHSLLTNRTKTCHLLYGQFCTRSWWSRQKRSINQMCTFDSRRMNTKRECCPSTEWQLGIVQESIGDLCQATAACRDTASPPCWRMYCHTHNTTLYQLNVFLYTASRQTYRILNLCLWNISQFLCSTSHAANCPYKTMSVINIKPKYKSANGQKLTKKLLTNHFS